MIEDPTEDEIKSGLLVFSLMMPFGSRELAEKEGKTQVGKVVCPRSNSEVINQERPQSDVANNEESLPTK